MKKNQSKLIVVLGPTSSGKSSLAVELAKRFSAQGGPASGWNGFEIISADSRQVYKGMDIGTGKITKKEMQGIPHYCLDLVSPRTQFSVAQYRQRALKSIDKIYHKNKIPILCGGTGFYIQAVVDGLNIPRVAPDWELRKELEKKSAEDLFKHLKKLDPHRAKNIDAKNRRRLIRAIEIVIKTGKPVPPLKFSAQGGPACLAGRQASGWETLFIGIKKDIPELKDLIKNRLLRRLKQGMIDEIRNLRKAGISWKRLDDFGLEYRYIAKYLKGELTKQEMIEKLQKEIEHYAKRQMTWFKRDKRIYWIKNYKEAEKLVRDFLEKKKGVTG